MIRMTTGLASAALLAAAAGCGHGAPREQAHLLHATPSTLEHVFSVARGGDTIVLASGRYPVFHGGAKSATVTLRPAPGATPSLSLELDGATNIRLAGVTITGAAIGGASRDITITHCRFTGPAVIRTEQMNRSRIVFDTNTHIDISPSPGGYEGRITLPGRSERHPSGVVIKNSLFRGGAADGIQDGSNGTQILDNEFTALRQGDAAVAHTDAIQLYGAKNTIIRGNYFHGVVDGVMAPDGSDHAVIEDNVFVTMGSQYAVTLGADRGSVVRHNTMLVTGLRIQNTPGRPTPAGTVITDNIMPSLVREAGRAVEDHNLLGSGALGPHDLHGIPRFVAGASPSGRAGFVLAAGSPGRGDASDGTDRGIGSR